MKIILCGGGTAGHINPAIAVAEEIKKQFKSVKILFIGREGGGENRLVTEAGLNLKTLKIQGFKRKLTKDNLKVLAYALKAKSEAKKILSDFKPDVVLGTGGYVCWPVIKAAAELHIPTAIHESNLYPGLTTRLLSKKCNTVFVNHGETENLLPQKANVKRVGNPLRSDFTRLNRATARAELGLRENDILIVSLGGSIGSERMNEVIIDVMRSHSANNPNIRHIHSAGARYYGALKDDPYARGKNGCRIVPYINDMPRMLHASDVVISRCGAVTLSELAEVGVAAILIPSPNVTDNHQYKNARYLEKKEAALLIEEKNLTKKSLISALKMLENDENGRKKQAKNIKALSLPNSSKLLVKELILLKKGV